MSVTKANVSFKPKWIKLRKNRVKRKRPNIRPHHKQNSLSQGVHFDCKTQKEILWTLKKPKVDTTKAEANQGLKSNASKSRLIESKKTPQKKEGRRKTSLEEIKKSPSIERVDEVKPKKPKSNLKKPKLNSVGGQSTPKSTWSHIDSHNDNFVQDVMSGLNETVSRLKNQH